MTLRAIFPAALALMLGAPALAQQNTQATTPTAASASSIVPSVVQPGAYRSIEDMIIVTADGKAVGEIEDVLVDASGQVVAVSVEVGGFLGIGDSEAIIPLDQLRLEGDRFMTSMTEAELEALPTWND